MVFANIPVDLCNEKEYASHDTEESLNNEHKKHVQVQGLRKPDRRKNGPGGKGQRGKQYIVSKGKRRAGRTLKSYGSVLDEISARTADQYSADNGTLNRTSSAPSTLQCHGNRVWGNDLSK